jgi:hypothetical protein
MSGCPHVVWALRQRGLTAAERVVLIYLANRANGALLCWPSVATIAEDCELSSRTVQAAIKRLSSLGLIRIERRHRQSHHYHILRPVKGADAEGAKSAPNSPQNPRPGKAQKTAKPPRKKARNHPAKSADESTKYESTKQESTKVHPAGVAGAAEAAPEPPPPSAGPAEQVGELVVKKKSPQEVAWGRWNKVAAQSGLVECEQPEKHVFIQLARCLKHSAIGQDIERWTAYLQWLANHERYGARDFGLTLSQAIKTDMIDRWHKTAKPIERNYQMEPDVEPFDVCDRPIAPGFDEETDPYCALLREERAKGGGFSAGMR